MNAIRWLIGAALLSIAPLAALAEAKLVRLYAPASLVDTGVLKFALPRFTLKTQVRVELLPDPDAEADMILGDSGRALFQGAGQVWRMNISNPDHPGTKRLADWLTSDVGQRTVLGYAPEGVALFEPPSATTQTEEVVALDGDAALGLEVSRSRCGRCHKVEATKRVVGIGSTPSFPVLRSLADWEERFSIFYVLNPHPAFTIITDLTEPFAEERPSPIVPIEMSLDEFEAMMAYVTTMPAADLGAPLLHQ